MKNIDNNPVFNFLLGLGWGVFLTILFGLEWWL